MTWLLGIGGLLKQGLSAVFGLIRTYPWQAACLALLLASLWLWQGNVSKDRQILSMKAEHAKFVAASEEAASAQQALNTKIQNTYQEQADGAQERHIARDAGMRSATSDFIRANRVQPGQCEAGGSNPSPAPSGAPVPQEPTASPVMVAVEQSDVEACAADYGYALSAYEWAKGLLDAGVAR